MEIHSPNIARAVEIAAEAGNQIQEVSKNWSEARQVVRMRDTLDEQTRHRIPIELPSLRYWTSPKTPHNAADEGYFCDSSKIGISFPVENSN